MSTVNALERLEIMSQVKHAKHCRRVCTTADSRCVPSNRIAYPKNRRDTQKLRTQSLLLFPANAAAASYVTPYAYATLPGAAAGLPAAAAAAATAAGAGFPGLQYQTTPQEARLQ